MHSSEDSVSPILRGALFAILMSLPFWAAIALLYFLIA